MLTPRHDGVRPWDTSMVRVHGPSTLTPEEVSDFDELWNRPPATGSSATPA